MENKIKLLLVEDDSMLTYVVKSSLEGLIGGYEVITAVNGQEGLKAYQEYHPDIIISDVDMPVMNGLQMVERIREVDGNIPILLASALGSPKDVTSGYKLGADNYVKKPFVAEELDAHIHALLKLRKGSLRAMKQIATTSGNTHWMPHTQPLGITKTVRKQC